MRPPCVQPIPMLTGAASLTSTPLVSMVYRSPIIKGTAQFAQLSTQVPALQPALTGSTTVPATYAQVVLHHMDTTAYNAQ